MITTRIAAWILAATALLGAGVAVAKLPPPGEAEKENAAKAAAAKAYEAKLATYALCRSMERVAAVYFERAKAQGKSVNPPEPTPPCTAPAPMGAHAEPAQPAATTTPAPPQVQTPAATAGAPK